MISVIIPTYNRPEYLEQAIESFVMQNYKDKEMIIIDDGSIKDYTELKKKYENNNDVRFFRINHSGCAAALNMGIKISSGKLVCVLADDDLLIGKDSLSRRVGIFDDKSIEVIYTGFQRIYYNGKIMSIETVEPVNKKKIWKQDYINIQTMMWRKIIHRNIGYFSEDLINNEDWEFKIKCLMECNVKAVDIITAASRYHNQNKSIVNRKATLKCADILIKRMKERYAK